MAVAAKSASDAAGLLRAAGGLGGAHVVAAACRDLAQPKGGLTADLVCETIEGIANRCGQEALAIDLLRDLKHAKGLPLDRQRLMRSACKALLIQAGLKL